MQNILFEVKFKIQKEGKMAIQARCMKCKDQKDMKDAQMTKTARGGFMAKGKCAKCGCGMCKIMSQADAEKAVASGQVKKAY